MEDYSKSLEAKRLEDLSLSFNGITLNNQDIDLILIAAANNPQELQENLSNITNIQNVNIPLNITQEQFLNVRQQVYDFYLNNLISRNDYFKNKNIEMGRKIQYLKSSGKLSNDEINTIDNIISTSRNKDEILEKLNKSFSPDKIHQWYEIIRDFSPIEKSGIKSSTLQASKNLLKEIEINYNSITIDEETKYGNIVLQDESFYFKHLQKSLNFAKSLNKQMRLNTLLFYMDCPDSLYNLEKTNENKLLVKQKLQSYVDATTKFIVDNGYSDIVRSVDVFNELLNRFPISGEKTYMYRGNIEQQIIPGQLDVNDNIKSGWLKHLDIADLCDVIATARRNMPTTDFMYNDDNLIDPRKIEPTIQLIEQIRENEKRLGVKLIDSIGTQMHIDNSITKEQIKEMIINLSQFGLPIEITEFDIAMTNGIDNLTEQQINTLRQSKINEIYECIDELRDQYNIRGFTIWSKTDKQNFRVSLANEERIREGFEPIKTLHGGYYNELIQPKQEVFQSFNYHTHTNRCGHAGISSDEEYVEYAKYNGITRLGFSDHVPVTELEYQDEGQQMHISDVDEYIYSIRRLQKENPNMVILCGFEAEFSPAKEQFLGELRDKVDYMILGQHYIKNAMQEVKANNNFNYPLEYANMVCKAMESGIFDIVAHPDIFMKFRDSMGSESKIELFDQNAVIASKQICGKAKELGIPLEINFGDISKNKDREDSKITYPNSLFWKIAAEYGVPVLYGIDAHDPKQFTNMDQYKKIVDSIIGINGLNFVDRDYNPVEARKNNQKLNELYEVGQSKTLTYETHMISQITESIISRIPDESFNPNDFSFISERAISDVSKNCTMLASAKDKENMSKIEEISNSTKLSTQEKKFKLNRAKSSLEHTNNTLSHQQTTLACSKESINTAVEIGCQSKAEIVSVVTQLTEEKTTKSEEKKSAIENNIQIIRTKNNQNANKEKTKNPVLVKTKNQKKNTTNNGFIDALILALITGFVCGIMFTITFNIFS